MYVQDVNGKIYEATLNIAKAKDGRSILYDISNIKEVDRGVVPSIRKEKGLAHKSQPHNESIPQNYEKGNKKVEQAGKSATSTTNCIISDIDRNVN